MEALVAALPEPSWASAAPRAKSDPPIVKATDATQLTRRRRRASAGVAAACSNPIDIAPRLRAGRDSQVASPPPGRSQRSRLAKDQPPSTRLTAQPSAP